MVFGHSIEFFGKEPPSILNIPKPHVALPADPSFMWVTLDTNTLIASWFTILVLAGVSIFLTRKMKLIPGKRQGLAEWSSRTSKFCGRYRWKETCSHALFRVATSSSTSSRTPISPSFLFLVQLESVGMEVNMERNSRPSFGPRIRMSMSLSPLLSCLFSLWKAGHEGHWCLSLSREFINVRQFLQGLKELFTEKSKRVL